MISGASDPILFQTNFDKPGNQTVTLQACNAAACNSLSTTVTVNPPLVPPAGTISCGPQTANNGDRISCTAQLTGTVTATAWTAPGGNPSSGSGSTFSTAYTTTGTQTITLQACNGPACANYTASVNILRKVDPTVAPTPPAQQKPVTITGAIQVTEGDIGCGFSAMPSSTGSITITLTFGASPGDPIVATGSFNGSTSGSRGVHCSGGSFNESYQANYSANFSGMVTPGGSGLVLNGHISITQSSSYSNCRDNDGNPGPCPAKAASTGYAIQVKGSISILPGGASASGSGALDLTQSGCSTAGSWNAH